MVKEGTLGRLAAPVSIKKKHITDCIFEYNVELHTNKDQDILC